MNAATPSDPTSIVESLDPEQLQQRLRQLDREQAAVRILLRAARARCRGQQGKRPNAANQEVPA